MKKAIVFLGILLSCFGLSLINNKNIALADSKTGWHEVNGHERYITGDKEDGYNVDKIDVIGHYLIDRNGNCHYLNIKRSGNHTTDALRVAKVIAKACRAYKGESQLHQVDMAAYYVACFSNRDRYTMKGYYYNTAYGVFCARQCSCAGSTAALGMVLHLLGYKYQHVNKNKYKHQWCKLRMDGRTGFADGEVGYASYGRHTSNTTIPANTIFTQKWMDD